MKISNVVAEVYGKHNEDWSSEQDKGERGFDRRECTKTYTTEAKRKSDTVLRRLYNHHRVPDVYGKQDSYS